MKYYFKCIVSKDRFSLFIDKIHLIIVSVK